jgi:arylsulfatase A-like enzyme
MHSNSFVRLGSNRLCGFTLLLGLIVATIASPSPRAADRPNIILVMTDDQGYGDLACHGHPLLKTPHLDRLHRESVRFTDFHVSPTCAPTRAALMTGRHEFKSGVTHTILERERLSLKPKTIAEVLRSAGYGTGIFGKWHLGDEPDRWPDKRGFDEMFIHGAGGIGQTYAGSCGDAPDNKYFDPAILHNGKFVKTRGYCTDVFFAQALNWMDERRKAGAPFFAYITPNAPHAPLVSPGPQYDSLYEGKSINGQRLGTNDVPYYAMISNIDDNVGKLLAKVKEWNLEKNTLVIFMTDNGGTHTKLFNAGMRGAKNTPYQGGTRVSAFWRWPAGFNGGADVKALTAHWDIFPTLAEIAGAKLGEDLRKQIEGHSLMPLLKNPNADWPDRFFVTHIGRWARGNAEGSKHAGSSIRNSRFTLVGNKELYDLANDPGETTNVIEQNPEVAAKLRDGLDQWWAEVLPCLENENVPTPKINSFKELYWKQFGGGPDSEGLKR